jgi:hypothetical protein
MGISCSWPPQLLSAPEQTNRDQGRGSGEFARDERLRRGSPPRANGLESRHNLIAAPPDFRAAWSTGYFYCPDRTISPASPLALAPGLIAPARRAPRAIVQFWGKLS